MKDFIKKISRGSTTALFLEVLLLVQVIVIIYAAIETHDYECHNCGDINCIDYANNNDRVKQEVIDGE